MSGRIELYERYVSNAAQIAEYENIGIDNIEKLIVYKYRRINPKVDDIIRVIEIVGNKQECKVKFVWGETIVVKANYDELCIAVNDIENDQLNDFLLGN